MLRAGLGWAMLVIAAGLALPALQAQASDRGRYCPCRDHYDECIHDGKSAQTCDREEQRCVWKECRR